jgi:multiple sugar transport system permease protein
VKRKKRLHIAVLYAILILVAIVMIFPFVWSVTASFKTRSQIYSGNPLDLIPNPATLNNYRKALSVLPFHRFLVNSLFLATTVPVISITLASMAAYSSASSQHVPSSKSG